MKELVLSDPERCLLSECVFLVFRLSLEGFFSDHFPAEKLHDLCLKIDGVDLSVVNDLFVSHSVDDPLQVVSVFPDYSFLGLKSDSVRYGN